MSNIKVIVPRGTITPKTRFKNVPRGTFGIKKTIQTDFYKG